MTRIAGGLPSTTTLSPPTFQLSSAPHRLEVALGRDTAADPSNLDRVDKKLPDSSQISGRPVVRPVMDVENWGSGSDVWNGSQAFLDVPGEADIPGSVDRWLAQNPSVKTIVIDAPRKNLSGGVHTLPERLGLPMLSYQPTPRTEETREAKKDLAALEDIARKRGITIVLSDPEVTNVTHAYVVTLDRGLQRLPRPPGSSVTR